MTLFTFSLQNLSVALAMSQLNKILFSTFSVFLKVQNLQKFSLMLRKCSQVFLKFFKGNHFDPFSTTRLKCNNYMSSFQVSSSSNIIIIFKYHQNWRGFWLSWGDPGESVLLRSRLPETPVHSSLYHHHQYHSIVVIIIIITISSLSIVHQSINIIICITSFCGEQFLHKHNNNTIKRIIFTIWIKVTSYHVISSHTPSLWISWSNWLLDSILGFGPSFGLFLVLVASITINLIQISCWRPSGHDSGQTAVSGDQNPILFHAWHFDDGICDLAIAK